MNFNIPLVDRVINKTVEDFLRMCRDKCSDGHFLVDLRRELQLRTVTDNFLHTFRDLLRQHYVPLVREFRVQLHEDTYDEHHLPMHRKLIDVINDKIKPPMQECVRKLFEELQISGCRNIKVPEVTRAFLMRIQRIALEVLKEIPGFRFHRNAKSLLVQTVYQPIFWIILEQFKPRPMLTVTGRSSRRRRNKQINT